MNRKRIFAALAALVLSLQCACGKPQAAVTSPEIEKIQSICELATVECYYHNVAKSHKAKGTGLAHIGERDRDFWIEYTGAARIGIDLSAVKLSVTGKQVRIALPEAAVLDIQVEQATLTENSYIVSEDGLFNRNQITAADQTAAIEDAQNTMRKTVENDAALLQSARRRAQTLIENYVVRLGEVCGTAYEIVWE